MWHQVELSPLGALLVPQACRSGSRRGFAPLCTSIFLSLYPFSGEQVLFLECGRFRRLAHFASWNAAMQVERVGFGAELGSELADVGFATVRSRTPCVCRERCSPRFSTSGVAVAVAGRLPWRGHECVWFCSLFHSAAPSVCGEAALAAVA